MDLFPRQPIDHQTKSLIGVNGAQITVIYDGKVFVFDEVSGEKAEEIIFLAKQKGSSRIYSLDTRQESPDETVRVAEPRSETGSSSVATKQIDFPSLLDNLSHDVAASMAQMSGGLPIARRRSLRRFLEKRHDRCVDNGPYHTSGGSSAAAAASKPREGKSWLGLAP